jgi:hypothetical protein
MRIVLVPVPRIGENEALRNLEAERMDICHEDQKARECLTASCNAEFGRLLDRVDGVTARIGKPDDLRFRGLRLQQE